jgi:hypothetical protein
MDTSRDGAVNEAQQLEPKALAPPGPKIERSKRHTASVPARFREDFVDDVGEPARGEGPVQQVAGKKRRHEADGLPQGHGSRKGRPPKKQHLVALEGHADSFEGIGTAPLVGLTGAAVAIRQTTRESHVPWPNPSHNDVGEEDEHQHYCTVCESNHPTLVLCDG